MRVNFVFIFLINSIAKPLRETLILITFRFVEYIYLLQLEMQPPQIQPQFNADQMPGAGQHQQQHLQYNAPPNQQPFQQPSAFNPPPPQMNRPQMSQPFNPASFQAPPPRPPTLGSMPPNQLQGTFHPPPMPNTQINQPPLMNSQTQLTNQISNLSLSTPDI